MVDSEMPQMTIRRMHCAFWITKVTDTQSEYVMLIGFPQQQWLLNGPQYYVIRILRVLIRPTFCRYVLISVFCYSIIFGM